MNSNEVKVMNANVYNCVCVITLNFINLLFKKKYLLLEFKDHEYRLTFWWKYFMSTVDALFAHFSKTRSLFLHRLPLIPVFPPVLPFHLSALQITVLRLIIEGYQPDGWHRNYSFQFGKVGDRRRRPDKGVGNSSRASVQLPSKVGRRKPICSLVLCLIATG